MHRPVRFLFLIALTLSVAGCNPAGDWVATRIFSAPNHRQRNGLEFTPAVQNAAHAAYARELRVPVAGAELAVGVIAPGT